MRSVRHKNNMRFRRRTNKPSHEFLNNPYHRFYVHISYDMFGVGFNHYKN